MCQRYANAPCLYTQKHTTFSTAQLQQIDSLDEVVSKWLKRNHAILDEKTIVTIPVVFHIVWNTPDENLSEELILSQLDVLNQDFRGLNEDRAFFSKEFGFRGVDIGIEFCIASTDPHGFATSGITRTQTTIENIGQRTALYYSDMGGKDAWDTKRYLNIWVADMGVGFAGFGSMPGIGEPERDGVIIDYDNLGLTNNPPYDLGRTLTHEVGHFFGLKHLWGTGINNDRCSDDDGIEDTPPQSRTYFGDCPDIPQYSCGSADMFMNFMNFADDACLTLFSQGQKLRMIATLFALRSGLLTSHGCSEIENESAHTLFTSDFQVYPNPTKDYIYFSTELVLNTPSTIVLTLRNLAGQIVRKKEVEHGTSPYFYEVFDVTRLAAGTYILTLTSDSFRTCRKILIQ